MMKRFILMGMTAAAMGSISSGAGAQTTVRAGRIDFNGVITATACQIQGNNQQMTVPLGTHFSQQAVAVITPLKSILPALTVVCAPAPEEILPIAAAVIPIKMKRFIISPH